MDLFYRYILNVYQNFPAKLQGPDNQQTIFNENSFGFYEEVTDIIHPSP